MRIQMKLLTTKNLLTAAGYLLVLLIVVGIRNLDAEDAAALLEKGFTPLGILFLVPLFFPEFRSGAGEMIASHPVNFAVICVIRILTASLGILLLTAGCIFLMLLCGSEAAFGAGIAGIFSAALFLGGLGAFAASLTRSTAVGYLISSLYYVVNEFAGNGLGWFSLFTLTEGSRGAAGILLPVGMLLLCAAAWHTSRSLYSSASA